MSSEPCGISGCSRPKLINGKRNFRCKYWMIEAQKQNERVATAERQEEERFRSMVIKNIQEKLTLDNILEIKTKFEEFSPIPFSIKEYFRGLTNNVVDIKQFEEQIDKLIKLVEEHERNIDRQAEVVNEKVVSLEDSLKEFSNQPFRINEIASRFENFKRESLQVIESVKDEIHKLKEINHGNNDRIKEVVKTVEGLIKELDKHEIDVENISRFQPTLMPDVFDNNTGIESIDYYHMIIKKSFNLKFLRRHKDYVNYFVLDEEQCKYIYKMYPNVFCYKYQLMDNIGKFKDYINQHLKDDELDRIILVHSVDFIDKERVRHGDLANVIHVVTKDDEKTEFKNRKIDFQLNYEFEVMHQFRDRGQLTISGRDHLYFSSYSVFRTHVFKDIGWIL